jgi:hypothetical protein
VDARRMDMNGLKKFFTTESAEIAEENKQKDKEHRIQK